MEEISPNKEMVTKINVFPKSSFVFYVNIAE